MTHFAPIIQPTMFESKATLHGEVMASGNYEVRFPDGAIATVAIKIKPIGYNDGRCTLFDQVAFMTMDVHGCAIQVRLPHRGLKFRRVA